MSCRINFVWDEEAAVWIATSNDIPGLVLESGSFDALVERLLSDNHLTGDEIVQLFEKSCSLRMER